MKEKSGWITHRGSASPGAPPFLKVASLDFHRKRPRRFRRGGRPHFFPKEMGGKKRAGLRPLHPWGRRRQAEIRGYRCTEASNAPHCGRLTFRALPRLGWPASPARQSLFPLLLASVSRSRTDQVRFDASAPSSGPQAPERRGRYKVRPLRQQRICRTARGKIQKGGRNPLFGRFKEGVQGEGNRNPSPCWPPLLTPKAGRPPRRRAPGGRSPHRSAAMYGGPTARRAGLPRAAVRCLRGARPRGAVKGPEAVGSGGLGRARTEFYRFVTNSPVVLTFGMG